MSELSQTIVFNQGDDGYDTFRIPAIVTAANGDLLAFAEARKKSDRDNGDIDLVLKRSTDGGTTWSGLQMVGELGDHTYGNPTPIVAGDGVIHLLTTSNVGADGKQRIREGASKDIRRVHYQKSADHGVTWRAPVEITAQATHAGAVWRWYATGPGHGIQLRRGPHAGRLIAPCNHSDHTTPADDPQEATNCAHVLYSDDAGATWHVGGMLPTNGKTIRPWESSAVELTDGRVHVNARNQPIGAYPRVGAYSDDGGESFGAVTHAAGLIESRGGVQGALLRYSAADAGDAGNRILFSNPASLEARQRMTVRSSFDETQLWNRGRVIWPGPAGYSDMTKLPDGAIGLLYENGDTKYSQRLTFARFTVEWLDAKTAD